MMIPLLSPKPFAEFTPADFKQYVVSLYVAPPVPTPPAEYSIRLNKKGNAVITVRRTPKFLTNTEIEAMAAECGFSIQRMWQEVRERDIEIRVPDYRARKKLLPIP